LELIYKARLAGGEWIEVNEHIPIERLEQSYGGRDFIFIVCLFKDAVWFFMVMYISDAGNVRI